MEERINTLVEKYHSALVRELDAREAASNQQALVETVRVVVLSQTPIDGKSADVRKRQEEMALADNERYLDALAEAETGKHQVELAAVIRKTVEVEVGLFKAFLYSQSGR